MEPIKIIIEETILSHRLVGEITSLSSNDIFVKMVSPYPGVSSEQHIAHSFRFHTVRNNHRYANTDGSLTDYGRQIAEDLLKDLFDYSYLFLLHREEIQKKYALYKKSVEEIGEKHLSDELYREKRKELRRQLRAGEIDLKVYEKTLWEMQKQNKKYDYEVFCVKSEFEKTVQKLCHTDYLPVMDLVEAFLKESDEDE